MSRGRAPANCAICGADIPPNAQVCPECGADDRTGWREQSIYDELDLPDAAFEDDQQTSRPEAQKSKARFWWLVALIMLAVVVVLVLRSRF